MDLLALLEELRELVEAEVGQTGASDETQRALDGFLSGFDNYISGDVDAYSRGFHPMLPANAQPDPNSIGAIQRITNAMNATLHAAQQRDYAKVQVGLGTVAKQLGDVNKFLTTALTQWDRFFNAHVPQQQEAIGEAEEPDYSDELFAQSLEQLATAINNLDETLEVARTNMNHAVVNRDPKRAADARKWLMSALSIVHQSIQSAKGFQRAAVQYSQPSGSIVGTVPQRRMAPGQVAQSSGQQQPVTGRVSPARLAQLQQIASQRMGNSRQTRPS